LGECERPLDFEPYSDQRFLGEEPLDLFVACSLDERHEHEPALPYAITARTRGASVLSALEVGWSDL
jgi:hypothetical protein